MIDMFIENKEEERKEFLARLKEFIKGSDLDKNLMIRKFFKSNSKQASHLGFSVNDFLD